VRAIREVTQAISEPCARVLEVVGVAAVDGLANVQEEVLDDALSCVLHQRVERHPRSLHLPKTSRNKQRKKKKNEVRLTCAKMR
jgi:hypothetical protein